MRVFLTGATGFIGGRICRGLAGRGHQITCLVRNGGKRRIESLATPGVTAVEGEFTRPDTWLPLVSGHDIVINAVGIIRESANGSFDQIHRQSPIALFEAAARSGVGKIVQISALGADDEAQSMYHLSKRSADRRLAELEVPYVILRPSFVYGPQDLSMTFFLSLAALPITPVPGDGQYRVQPIHVDDLVRAVWRAVERHDIKDLVVDAGGQSDISFDALLDVLAERLGKTRARKLHVPWRIMELAAAQPRPDHGR